MVLLVKGAGDAYTATEGRRTGTTWEVVWMLDRDISAGTSCQDQGIFQPQKQGEC